MAVRLSEGVDVDVGKDAYLGNSYELSAIRDEGVTTRRKTDDLRCPSWDGWSQGKVQLTCPIRL